MFNISSFLEKFTKQVGQAELNTKEICDIVTLRSGVPCSPEHIEIKNYILYITTSPTFKQKILMSKEGILRDLKQMSLGTMVDIL